jgi:hypothetical protein
MSFSIVFSSEANAYMNTIETNPALSKRCKAVLKALAFLELNPRHAGLKTHKFSAMIGPNGEDVFEVYAEINTPGAYWIFWVYGPCKDVITIVAITAHP